MAGFGLNPRHANVRDQLNHARQEPFSGFIACRICESVFMSEKALFDHIELHLLLDESAAKRKVLQSHLSSTQRSLPDNRFNQNSPLLSTRRQVLQQPTLSALDNGYASSILPNERNLFSFGTNTRNLDLQSTVPSPISTCSRNNNMPLLGTNTRNLDLQSTIPSPISTCSRNNNMPLLGTNTRNLDLQSTVTSPISTCSRNNKVLLLGTNTRNLDLKSTVPSPISTSSRNDTMPLLTHPTTPVAPQIIFVPQPRIDCFTRPFLNQLETTLLVDGMASFVDREIAANVGDEQKLDVTLKLGRKEN